MSAGDQIAINLETANNAALLSSILSLAQRLEDVATCLASTETQHHNAIMRCLDVVEKSVRRIAVQPVV